MYLLDANAFMEANRLYYAFDIAPGFWTWLEDPALNGKVASIQAIRGEITAGSGDLVDWAKRLPSSFWLPDTTEVVGAMAQVSEWANSPDRQYKQAAVTEFMGSADLSRIKIPDVCNAFNVTWTDPFSAYRLLGLRLN